MMMTGKIGQLTLAPFARIGAAKVLFIVPFFFLTVAQFAITLSWSVFYTYLFFTLHLCGHLSVRSPIWCQILPSNCTCHHL